MKSKNFFKGIYYLVISIRIFSIAFFIINPLLGWFVCLLLDTVDYTFAVRFTKSYGQYQYIDKFLDFLSRIYFLYIAYLLSWPNIWIFVVLFIIRLIGDILYFYTKKEKFLFYFPNTLEYFFPLYIFILPSISVEKIVFILIISTVIKLIQEYLLHIKKWIDPFNLEYLRKHPEHRREI